MSRGDHIEIKGQVTESLCGKFKISTDSGQVIMAQLSGKLRQNKIHITVGDKVTVALSPYDLSHGIIVYRD